MRRLSIVWMIAAVLTGCTGGAGPDTPEASGGVVEEFWSHRFAVSEDVAYGEDPAQVADLYLQGSWVGEPTYFEAAPEPRPTLLFIHGGGWVQGDKTGQDPWFLPFVQRGWHVVNMTYRLGPGTAPDAVDDAVCALRWVVDSAGEYGFDRNRIVVSGGSAGGHLALMAGILGSREGHPCYPGEDFRVGAVVNWYGITDIQAVDSYLAEARPDFNYARAWAGDPSRIPGLSTGYSPLAVVDGRAPPILTIHGEADSVVPHDQAVTFHSRLDDLGTGHELRSMPGGTHVGFTEEQFQEAFSAIFAFLDEVGLD
jgi:acetyl esterase/lipase